MSPLLLKRGEEHDSVAATDQSGSARRQWRSLILMCHFGWPVAGSRPSSRGPSRQDDELRTIELPPAILAASYRPLCLSGGRIEPERVVVGE